MSQIMVVQPLLDAGKGANTNSANKNQNTDAGNPFQSLLQGKIEAHSDKKVDVQSESNREPTDKQKISSSENENKQSAEAKSKETTEESHVDKMQEDAAVEESTTTAADDATLLAQIMASAVGAQIVPVEPVPQSVAAEFIDEKSFLVSDESVIVDSKSTLKNDGMNLPTEYDTTDFVSQSDTVDYTRVQADASHVTQEESFIEMPVATSSTPSFSATPAVTGQPTEVVINAATEASVAEIQQPQGLSQQSQAILVQTQPINQSLMTANPVESRITQQLGSAEWGQAIGQRVVWMVSQAQQSASLTISPPELGPIRVVVNLSNNNANANFYSSNPEVRTALEGTLPRLKEIMEEAGIQLGQAHVGSEDSRNAQSGEYQVQNAQVQLRSEEGENESISAPQGQEVVKTSAKGLVDTFV